MLEGIEAGLIRGGLAAPLDVSDPDAVALWCAYDLAAVVESCFGVRTLPLAAAREPWLDRLGGTYLPPFPEVLPDTRRLFLLHDAEPAGTLALPRESPADLPMSVSCLYLRPQSRKLGLASRVLSALQTASRNAGRTGIQLDTHWPWQSAVRFYLRRRMWVMGWVPHLSFAWLSARPSWEVEVDENRMALISGGRTCAETYRRGAHLTGFKSDDPVARATLALNLAVRGWPLVREAGPHPDEPAAPERLREAIELAELRARELGWIEQG